MNIVSSDPTLPAETTKALTGRILKNSDFTVFRWLFGLASFGWCATAFLNHFVWNHGLVTIPAYALLMPVGNEYVSADVIWGLLFAVHWIGVTWRLRDPVSRIGWARAINGYGFALWTTVQICIVYSLGYVPNGTSMEFITCGFSAWALYMTDLRKEMVTS